MLRNLSIIEFLEKTASDSPVPGGGSVAALAAAVSASLAEMVANLTIGKKGFEDVDREMKAIAKETRNFRKKLVKDIDKDADSYNQVVAAYKMAKATDEEKLKRTTAIQEALKQAALVPLKVAGDAADLLELAGNAAKKGNKNAITDAAVGVMMARTAVLAALYNVKTNLNSIKDPFFVDSISKEVNALEAKILQREKDLLAELEL
jgi:formiminotetrahydrofolate cyclodeaminase